MSRIEEKGMVYQMKIGVIGGGAIGLLIASHVDSSHEVIVYTRTKEQAEVIVSEGVYCKRESGDIHRELSATQMKDSIDSMDIVFVAVKQYSMSEIHSILREINAENIIFIQNGMGHVDKIDEYVCRNVSVGIVEHGAMKLGDNIVSHTGMGRVCIGSVRGEVEGIENIFGDILFPIEYERDWGIIATKKLIVNIAINPLTAILKITNGELIQNKYYHQLMKEIFEEAYNILEVGNKQECWKSIVSICEKTAMNKSSMLRDIENKRKTEVDSILGYILKIADKKGITTPILSFLFSSVKGMEESFAFVDKLDYNFK